jgi:ethanolamine utilization microcompartment shell protein EutS
LNKKLQKGLVAAVAATLSTGIVAPVYAASVETKSFDAQYAEAYNATVNAKTQKELTAARVLVDKLYADLPQDLKNLAATLSAILDPKQQTELVKLDTAIKAASVSGKQTDVNIARALIVDMPTVWKTSFSSYMDGIQQPIITKAVEAAKKAQVSGLQVDLDAAKALYDELATVTNNDGVKSWVETALKAELDKVVLQVLVSGVSASSVNTLTVTGQGLNKLAAEDITIVGNAVTSVTAAADGKSAVVTFDANLAPNTETTVTVKDAAQTKDYTVEFGFVVKTVTVSEGKFDDERADQYVTFKVNGQSAAADLDYLALSGYSVNFVALDSHGNAAGIFDGGATSSSDGLLDASFTTAQLGNYTIEVQVIGNGDAIVSDKGTINISNIDANATSVGDATFVNAGADLTYDSVYATSVKADDFKMVSKTLVAGESAAVYKVTATVGGETTTLADDDFSIKSSNVAVVSVTKDLNGNYILTGESAGTATITVTVGTVTKTYTFTVTNTARKLTSVKPSTSKVTIIKGKTTDVTFTTFDQYGDPIEVGTGDVNEVIPVSAGKNIVDDLTLGNTLDIVTDEAAVADGYIGKTTVSLLANYAGSGTVYFKNASGTVLGSLVVSTTSVDNIDTSKDKLTIQTSTTTSADNSLDYLNSNDDSVVYSLAQYNSNGVFAGNADLGGYTLQVVNPGVATVTSGLQTSTSSNGIITVAAGETEFSIAASDIATDLGVTSKSTTVVVKRADGTLVGQFTIAVSDVPYKITGVSFKSVPKVDYVGKMLYASSVLNLTASTNDDIVTGVTLNKTTSAKVRIAELAGSGIAVNDLYIDMDNDGLATSGDIKLGTLVVTATADSTLTTAAPTSYLTGDYVNTGLTDAKTASGDKGTLLVKIQTGTSVTTAIAGTSIVIDVK